MKIRLSELRILLEVLLNDKLRSVLLKIDNNSFHMMPSKDLSPRDSAAVKALQARGFVKFIKADKRFPERYVLSGAGQAALGTFDFNKM